MSELIRIECKSYVFTLSLKNNDDESKVGFDCVAPVTNRENPADMHMKPNVRILIKEDEVFFKNQFSKVLVWFI